MEQIKKENQTNLEILMSDLAFGIVPEFIKDSELTTAPKNIQKFKDYFDLVATVSKSFAKINRYSVIFSEFYPSGSKISNTEALEHHVHSYLEDLDILKNKLNRLLGYLKNDIKKDTTIINRDDVFSGLKLLIDKICDGFENVSDNRNPHHHKGKHFTDLNLVTSQAMSVVLAYPEFLNENGLEIIKQKESESFEKAKKSWIEKAEKNDQEISRLINDIFSKINPIFYQYLNLQTRFV